jgi:nucleoside phosphorylase
MVNPQRRPTNRSEFEIAIICALSLEANAVLCCLDERYDDKTRQQYSKSPGDPNSYEFGRTGKYDVVVVTLPTMGKVAASSSATSLNHSFGSIKLALLVGVCGAVPVTKDGTEILLGDVIISEMVVELDFGRQYPNGFKRKDTVKDIHGRPNHEILGLLNRWKTPYHLHELQKRTLLSLAELLKHENINTRYPGAIEDKLFDRGYIHKHHIGCFTCNYQTGSIADICDEASITPCEQLQCDESKLVSRRRQITTDGLLGQGDGTGISAPFIHFGSIGTADTVMKSAEHRDNCADTEGVIAFEMEGAGVWDKFNCLIIKGVCDYADSHKNKEWQNYAAAVAASAMKEVLAQYVKPDNPSQPDIPNRGIPLPSTKDVFDSALKEFKKGLEDEKIQKFQSTTIGTLKRELKKIQDEQEKSKSLRNLRRVQDFIKSIEQLSKLIEGFLGPSQLICFVWGPVQFLLQVMAFCISLFLFIHVCHNLLDWVKHIIHMVPVLNTVVR